MSDAASWLANKLGQQQPQPRGIQLLPQPVYQQPVQYAAPQQPQVQYSAPPVAPGHQQVLDPNRPANAEIHFGEALQLWQGGVAHRREGHLRCPACDSATGYTQYSNTMGPNGHQHRPHCFECGYNGAFTQGLESSWA